MARVLVIEDQPTIGMVFNIALTEEGHKVEVVQDGRSGLERLARGPKPDIVFVDLLMPGINGRCVVEAMDADPYLRDIPVVIVSGCIPKDDVLPPAGSYESFIGKPFDLLELFETVDRLTSGGQAVCA